ALVAAVLLAALVAGPARDAAAQIPIPDPVKLALLAKIIAALEEANRFLARVNGSVREFRDLQALMFPDRVLDAIQTFFRPVSSILQEIDQLACGWRFAPRVELVRLGLLKRGALCRREYQGLFGAPVPGLDADLAELRQWSAVRRMNTVATTF